MADGRSPRPARPVAPPLIDGRGNERHSARLAHIESARRRCAHRTRSLDLPDPRLIIPLDVPTRADAEALVERLSDAVSFYKVGLQLLATGGMALARDLKTQGHQVFADWKLHDIGATVEKATAAIAAAGACNFLTVHAEPQVMRAAVRGRAGSHAMKILGVTVLTSLSEEDLKDLGYGLGVEALVERRIRQAIDAGIDGVVASPFEAAMARRIGGPDFLVVTPGVRPAWAGKDDQARAATPAEALAAGASHLVCGRPITAASDPREAAVAVSREMAGA
jgi:orotidine-5'-phosphate decarboxylase